VLVLPARLGFNSRSNAGPTSRGQIACKCCGNAGILDIILKQSLLQRTLEQRLLGQSAALSCRWTPAWKQYE
jgi:hypothetical protein